MEAATAFIGVLLMTVLLLLTVVVFILYSGLLTKVEVGAGKPPIKNIQVAYKFGRGPYRDTGHVFTEATSISPQQRCIGVYYDDPKQIPEHKLRWVVGSILSEGNETASPEVEVSFKKHGFHVASFPAVSSAVRATFPYRTPISALIGIFRVYPLLGEYVRVNRLCAHPWMEIYDGQMIYYMAPLARQDEFYVPEALAIDVPEDNDDVPQGHREDNDDVPQPSEEIHNLAQVASQKRNIMSSGERRGRDINRTANQQPISEAELKKVHMMAVSAVQPVHKASKRGTPEGSASGVCLDGVQASSGNCNEQDTLIPADGPISAQAHSPGGGTAAVIGGEAAAGAAAAAVMPSDGVEMSDSEQIGASQAVSVQYASVDGGSSLVVNPNWDKESVGPASTMSSGLSDSSSQLSTTTEVSSCSYYTSQSELSFTSQSTCSGVTQEYSSDSDDTEREIRHLSPPKTHHGRLS